MKRIEGGIPPMAIHTLFERGVHAMKTKYSRDKYRLIIMATLMLAVASSTPALAGLQEEEQTGGACGNGTNDVLIGQDNDNIDNPLVQPPGTEANQSLNNTDVLLGEGGCDVLIGLLGSDVIDGGANADIIIGGTEQGTPPNSDIMFGGPGNDINIWAGGDGSEAFLGGPGERDALIFAVIDRDGNNVPILSPVSGQHRETGLPTADLSNAPGFCTVEPGGELGYDFLVRFFVRATGALAVTVRVADVEQVFCSSTAGGSITYADLTVKQPQFLDISFDEVRRLNRTVAQIVR